MKKGNTTSKQATGLTVGIDLGDKYSQVCVLDEDGEVIEEGQIRTSEAALRRRFTSMEASLVVIEVGTHSPWVSRLVDSLGHECLVANPASIHRRGGKKTDKVDATKLARWGRSDPQMLEPVRHASAEVQMDMALVHSRRSLVEVRTKLINRARGLVKSAGERLPKCDADVFAAKVAPYVPPDLLPAVEPLLASIAQLTAAIAALDERVEELATQKYGQATEKMLPIKGVGAVTSLTYVLTLRTPERFRKSRQVGPYLGLTRRLDQSGASDPELGISKAGNAYLRQLLIQAAHYILERGPDCDLKRWGLAKAAGGKKAKKRAVVAVARKLAVLLHHLWLSGEDYEPLRQSAQEGGAAPSPAPAPV